MGQIYALITREYEDTGKRKYFDNIPAAPGDIALTKNYWVPLNKIKDNQSTTNFIVIEEPVLTVYPDRVEEITVIRDKTPTELDADDDKAMAELSEVSSIDRAQFREMFALRNAVRELEGKQPITVEQYKTYLKGLIR